jgi:hypothetical protein
VSERQAASSRRAALLAGAGIIVLDLLLDFGGGLELVGQARGVGELGVDLAEIHLREIEPGELVDGEAKALLGLGLAPGLVQLLAALFLQDPRSLDSKQQ